MFIYYRVVCSCVDDVLLVCDRPELNLEKVFSIMAGNYDLHMPFNLKV